MLAAVARQQGGLFPGTVQRSGQTTVSSQSTEGIGIKLQARNGRIDPVSPEQGENGRCRAEERSARIDDQRDPGEIDLLQGDLELREAVGIPIDRKPECVNAAGDVFPCGGIPARRIRDGMVLTDLPAPPFAHHGAGNTGPFPTRQVVRGVERLEVDARGRPRLQTPVKVPTIQLVEDPLLPLLTVHRGEVDRTEQVFVCLTHVWCSDTSQPAGSGGQGPIYRRGKAEDTP